MKKLLIIAGFASIIAGFSPAKAEARSSSGISIQYNYEQGYNQPHYRDRGYYDPRYVRSGHPKYKRYYRYDPADINRDGYVTRWEWNRYNSYRYNNRFWL